MRSTDSLVASLTNEFGVTEAHVREIIATLGKIGSLGQELDGTFTSRYVTPTEGEVSNALAYEARNCLSDDIDAMFHHGEYDELRAQGPEAFTAELRRRLANAA